MKIIDLLNKIANSKDYKDIPKKVKITTGTLNEKYRIWVWEGCWYIYEEDGLSVCICTNKLDLNDEVEILEEEKKIPEKLGECAYVDGEIAYSWSKSEAILKTRINEIIDYLKSKGE